MGKFLDILAFSPHPDDAELGCAGSIILAAQKGLRVAIVDMSEGELSSRGTAVQRGKEKRRASALLGRCERFSLHLPDSRIGTNPAHRLSLIQTIRKTRPRIILAPYWKDRHPDHVATSKMVKEACFYAGVARIGRGKPFWPEHLFYYMLHHPFEPSVVVDISSVWQLKMDVLAAYHSQFQEDGRGLRTVLNQPEFMRFIEARAIYFGATIAVAYGEPFFVPGPVALRDLAETILQTPKRRGPPPYSMFG
jgi:bacillithiol biosynthesis deacetylase BshB1